MPAILRRLTAVPTPVVMPCGEASPFPQQLPMERDLPSYRENALVITLLRPSPASDVMKWLPTRPPPP
ncbi:MAG: hypothetical protein AAGD07_01630 [Planctomycetota bacterium]